VLVDLSPGVNLFPDLRLVDNIKEEYEASLVVIDDIMSKMTILGASDLITSLHRQPENNFTDAQTQAGFEKALRWICDAAGKHGITIHLRTRTLAHRPYQEVKTAANLVQAIGAANLKLAASTGVMLARGITPNQAKQMIAGRVGLWLVSSIDKDVAGVAWNANASIADCDRLPTLKEYLLLAPNATAVLDAVYDGWDAEYRDANALSGLSDKTVASHPHEYEVK
jgi:hypothetical protein